MNPGELQTYEQLLEDFYGIKILPGAGQITVIKAGVENTNLIVKSGLNPFIFRLYNLKHSIRGERSKESIEQELAFSEQAIISGIPAPEVIRNINGEKITTFLQEDTIRYSALFSFLPGKSPETYTVKRVSEVAKVTNTLFEVGKHFEDASTKTNFDIISRALSKYEEINISTEEHPKDILLELQKLHRRIQDLLSSVDLKQVLSKGLVHGDLKLENMLFDTDDTLTAVLDFDDYRYSYLLEEATMALMHNLHSSTENIIRSGNYPVFIGKRTNPLLTNQLHHLSLFLQARFLYDLCKYLSQKKYDLVYELLKDSHLKVAFE